MAAASMETKIEPPKRMDVPALHLLQQQKSNLQTLSNPVNTSVTFDQYESNVSTTMSRTQDVIYKVSVYAENILNELGNIREAVKLCSIKLGEQMEKLIKDHFRKEQAKLSIGTAGVPYTSKGTGGTKGISSPPKGFDIDKEKVEQTQRMLTLAKQQQDLMTLIAKTEALALNIEKDADISFSDVMGISDQLSQWRHGLETVEEQVRRIKEDKEKEERSKREKEEAERKKKNEEKARRQKDEDERRQKEREKREAEQKRLKEEKEKQEKTNREKEEAERRKKEEAENAKREKDEAERRKKEEAEKAKREKDEAERRKKEETEKAKREKEEAERRKKEEAEKAKREKDEAERRKKEETEKAQREKEEIERRQKELEQIEAEEKSRKQEEEAQRRDWKNWPPFMQVFSKYHTSTGYDLARRNAFNQDICCVVFAMPDGITKDEIICTASDNENDLGNCLESNDEEIISALISIQCTNDNRLFEMPIRVYVPVVTHDKNLVSTLKFTIEGKNWKTGTPLPEVRISEISGVIFVGVAIPTKRLEYVQCVAVARHMRDETEVDGKGKVFEPKVDRNIKVKFPPDAFSGKTVVSTKASQLSHKDIERASKKYKELQNIKIAGSYIDITCENNITKDSELDMYDFGWVVDKNMQKKTSVTQETLNRCSRWLVNHINPDDNSLADVFDSDFVDELKTKESHGDKNRHILRKLNDTNESDFDKFVDCLKTTQSDVANRIIQVKSQVNLCRNIPEATTEDNFASDFDPDFEKKEGTVRIVSKVTDRSWEIVPMLASEDHPKARFLKLTSGHDKFQFLGLVVPDGMSDEDICRAAEILEGLNCVTNVSVICRQKHSNPHDAIIQCVKTKDLYDTFQHLEALGYNEGPADSSEFGVVDGEEIEMKVEPNLCFSNSLLKVKFYKNLPFERFSGNLSVVNKGDQLEGENYHGSLVYNVLPGRLSITRAGALVLYVPKPLEEMIGKFPFTLDVPVKALAKFISWQLTKDNFNSTRWVKLAGYLTDSDTHFYHQIVQRVDEERKRAPQRERCEMFILYWANHFTQSDTDKIEKIIMSHHDQGLEAEARQFIKPYMPGKGLLSNDNLEKMACVIANDWQTMAEKLGLSRDHINTIRSTQQIAVKQTLQMLDTWRLSDSAIQKGTDLIKSLHETAKAAQCGAKLISMLSNNV